MQYIWPLIVLDISVSLRLCGIILRPAPPLLNSWVTAASQALSSHFIALALSKASPLSQQAVFLTVLNSHIDDRPHLRPQVFAFLHRRPAGQNVHPSVFIKEWTPPFIISAITWDRPIFLKNILVGKIAIVQLDHISDNKKQAGIEKLASFGEEMHSLYIAD